MAKHKKKKFDYFEAFEKQAEVACDAAEILVAAIENFTTAAELPETLAHAHEVENRGDEVNHKILNSVAVDFITPIDREDIIELAQCLDNVIDEIEAVIQCFYMYDIRCIHEDCREFAELIVKSTKALKRAMGDFRNFRKSKKFRQLIMNVNDYEEQGDALHLETMRRLYTTERDDAIRVGVWTRIFDRMERCCDRCEHVADIMNNVMLKNV